jgi:flagellar export protein FliJ
MGASKALERLLHVREMEEEQQRLDLESALGRLQHLERAREKAGAREREGRALVGESVQTGHLVDRQAGLVETSVASNHARALAPRIAAAEEEVLRRRQEFLEKRVERRQAETLIEEAEAQEAVESGRRSQRNLDDWFGSRKHRGQAG